MRRHILYIIAALMVMAISSCDSGMSYDHYNSVSVEGWNRTDTLHFSPGKLPSGNYAIDVGFRATEAYPYRELGLQIEWTVFPRGKNTTKKIKCEVFDSEGRMEGTQSVSSSDFLFHAGDVALRSGDSLAVTVTHCMNRDVMPGLTSVGIQVRER